MLDETKIVEAFRRTMLDQQIGVSAEIIPDGKLHRVHIDGDKKGTRNGWYTLHLDGRPAGAFGCNKRFGQKAKFTWAGETKELTPEEKREWARRLAAKKREREAIERAQREAAAARANAIWETAKPCTGHPYLRRKGVASHGLRWGRWEWINDETGEVRLATDKALLIPIRDAKKQIHSLQAIFPSKIGNRDKDFLKHGAKAGLFFSIGKPVEVEVDGRKVMVIIIGEGYATLASIHEATGHACVVAFDAGNLLPVARVIRQRFPDALIIIAADNDQWTDKPVVNPGVTHAREAAKAVGARVIVPQFDHDDPAKPSDFNDLALRSPTGPAFVKGFIDAAINPPPPPAPAPAPEPPPPREDAPPAPAPAAAPPAADDDGDDGLPEENRHFAILGYDHERYFIFQHGKRQIHTITKGDMGKTGLIELAPLNWWELNFPGTGKEGGIDTGAAANFIIRTAEKCGIYDISRIRGRGAWVDQGRMVYHHGSYLTVDGEPTDITKIRSRFVYELDRSLPDPGAEPMSSDEGEMLLEVAGQFRWTKPGSAALLAGWVALAPVCGALRWRPHVWLTGGAGCGKSTVLNDFVHLLLGGLDLYAQGSSSEAGIRQTLRADARPVLFDESESNEESDARRIQNVLSLIRQASTESEALTLKGTAGGDAMAFHIRSMFCLASIQVAIKHQADVERLAVLALRPKREETNAAASWAKLSGMLRQIGNDETLPGRLFRRSLDLLPVTLKNIKVFTTAAAERFNSQRDGDQYGTLLAGAWSLISTGVATKEQALEMIDRYDWSEHRENNDMDEGARALSALMEAHIRVNGGIEVTVYELVAAACGQPTELTGIDSGKADAFLQRHGMKVKGDRLLVSNTSQELKKLMAGTPFEADLRGMLLRVEGADRGENKTTKFSGALSKFITLPLGSLLDDAGARMPF